ncbi:hypothetical protein [Roseateles sp. 22389]|uniref:hypothetical protein n=1 Tax=Roseateles sp. 22389 TaxID=3453916 RepID=UPI003F83DAB9
MRRSSIGKDKPMRRAGITIIFTLATTTRADALDRERRRGAQTRNSRAQGGRP